MSGSRVAKLVSGVLIVVVGTLLLLATSSTTASPTAILHVSFIDVGQGDSALVCQDVWAEMQARGLTPTPAKTLQEWKTEWSSYLSSMKSAAIRDRIQARS